LAGSVLSLRSIISLPWSSELDVINSWSEPEHVVDSVAEPGVELGGKNIFAGLAVLNCKEESGVPELSSMVTSLLVVGGIVRKAVAALLCPPREGGGM
jgi:hypothetical protein